jgi:hypothetical protein
MNWIDEYCCPLCDEILEEEEIVRGDEVLEKVFVCKNKDCENYDEIVLNENDILEHKQEQDSDREREEEYLREVGD